MYICMIDFIQLADQNKKVFKKIVYVYSLIGDNQWAAVMSVNVIHSALFPWRCMQMLYFLTTCYTASPRTEKSDGNITDEVCDTIYL